MIDAAEEVGTRTELVEVFPGAGGLGIPEHGTGQGDGPARGQGDDQLTVAGRACRDGAGIDSEGGRDADGVEGAPGIDAAAAMLDPMPGRSTGQAANGQEAAARRDLDPAPGPEVGDGRVEDGSVAAAQFSQRHRPPRPQGPESGDGDAAR